MYVIRIFNGEQIDDRQDDEEADVPFSCDIAFIASMSELVGPMPILLVSSEVCIDGDGDNHGIGH